MTPDIKTIRAAIEKRHGGSKNIDDTGIMAIWDSIDSETQKEYLTERKSDANSIGSKRNVQSDPGD